MDYCACIWGKYRDCAGGRCSVGVGAVGKAQELKVGSGGSRSAGSHDFSLKDIQLRPPMMVKDG